MRRGLTPVVLTVPKGVRIAPDIDLTGVQTFMNMVIKSGPAMKIGACRDPAHWPAEMEWEVVQ